VLLLKDIHNLRAVINECQRDVTLVLSEHAASNPDDDVWLLIDDISTVHQIFIQTAAMKEMFAKFPEVVMLDETSSINNCGMPLYAFLVQDGHGHGQLVGLCLLAGDDSSQMQVKQEMFANANQNIAQTLTKISQKLPRLKRYCRVLHCNCAHSIVLKQCRKRLVPCSFLVSKKSP